MKRKPKGLHPFLELPYFETMPRAEGAVFLWVPKAAGLYLNHEAAVSPADQKVVGPTERMESPGDQRIDLAPFLASAAQARGITL